MEWTRRRQSAYKVHFFQVWQHYGTSYRAIYTMLLGADVSYRETYRILQVNFSAPKGQLFEDLESKIYGRGFYLKLNHALSSRHPVIGREPQGMR